MGMVVFAPLASLITKKPFALTAMKYGVNGAAFGVVVGPIMTESMLYAKKATPESVWDRCYRLRYNRGQVRTDKFATLCALTGATVTGVSGKGPLFGAVIGIATGTIIAGAIGSQPTPPAATKPKPVAKETKE